MKNYDAVIIGFGKGGKTLAVDLAQRGMTVAMIERSPEMYGGTCINVGCIPTKSLIHQSERLEAFADRSFEQKSADYKKAIAKKNALTALLRQKNFENLNSKTNIKIYTGIGSFVSAHEIKIQTGQQSEIISGKKIFINTGSETVIPDIPGIKNSHRIYTSETLMQLENLPEKLVIIGGGYIGLEFASMYASFGSKVTILEGGSRFLPRDDSDVVANIRETFEKRGVKIVLNAAVKSIQDEKEQAVIRYTDETGRELSVSSDAVLVAVGRKSNAAHLNAEAAGIKLTPRGAVEVNARLETNVPGIWAMGDVTGGLQFTYISLDDYRIIRDSLFGEGKRNTQDRTVVPYTVFIEPPFSRIGMTEEDALQKGYKIHTSKIMVSAIPRMRILEKTDGLLKAVVHAETGEILGCSLFCPDSGEVINLIALAMKSKLPYTFLRDDIFTHPSVSEALNDLFYEKKFV